MGAIPQHVAIIMDGNGRWAKAKQLSRLYGHKKGADALEATIRQAHRHGVSVLTVFALSTENIHRPKEEIDHLFQLFIDTLHSRQQLLLDKGIRFRVIGERSVFPTTLIEMIDTVEKRTEHNTALTLIVAAHFGGHWDIMQAVKKAAQNNKPEQFARYMSLATVLPESLRTPDLLIRTGGEQRISNFLLWDLAYSELYFTDTAWPDFDADCFDKAIAFFQSHERRFGQIQPKRGAIQ